MKAKAGDGHAIINMCMCSPIIKRCREVYRNTIGHVMCLKRLIIYNVRAKYNTSAAMG